MKRVSVGVRIVAVAAFLFGTSIGALAQSETGIFTHHHDNYRSGWNPNETILTPGSLSSASSTFGVIATINNLVDTVYAQPLIVPNLQIGCPANQTIVRCQTGLSGHYQ